VAHLLKLLQRHLLQMGGGSKLAFGSHRRRKSIDSLTRSLFLPIPLLTILFRSGLWKRLMPLTHVSGSSMETSIRSSSFCHLMSAFD